MLSLFLRFKLALWVMIGLPVCFLGAVMLMPMVGVSLNVVSLFAFIMVLGIVVDDAIVIGESAYTEIERSGPGVESGHRRKARRHASNFWGTDYDSGICTIYVYQLGLIAATLLVLLQWLFYA